MLFYEEESLSQVFWSRSQVHHLSPTTELKTTAGTHGLVTNCLSASASPSNKWRASLPLAPIHFRLWVQPLFHVASSDVVVATQPIMRNEILLVRLLYLVSPPTICSKSYLFDALKTWEMKTGERAQPGPARRADNVNGNATVIGLCARSALPWVWSDAYTPNWRLSGSACNCSQRSWKMHHTRNFFGKSPLEPRHPWHGE